MQSLRSNAAQLRKQLEETLDDRMPGALSPRIKSESERIFTGVQAFDEVVQGVPVGALTELVGPECSGRTTVALALVASVTQKGVVSAWIDVGDALDPTGAAMNGVDLLRMLWVRCRGGEERLQDSGPTPLCKHVDAPTRTGPLPAHTGGGSPHPRSEGRAMPAAIQDLLLAQPRSGAIPAKRKDKSIGTPGAPNRPVAGHSFDREEQVPTDRLPPRRGEQLARVVSSSRLAEPRWMPDLSRSSQEDMGKSFVPVKDSHKQRSSSRWAPLDQAMRATDLLLQAGGFNLIVLDLGSTPAEMSWRIPLATWFRFRAACERTQTTLLLLTRHPCARSSAELMVRMQQGRMESQGNVLTGIAYAAELERKRFPQSQNKVVSIRKPPRPDPLGTWRGVSPWAIPALG